MSNRLGKREQELILDFYFRCGSKEDIDEGRDLIASSPEAAKLYANLETSLTDLDHIKYEPCPDNLVDLTVARLKLAAGSPRSKTSNSRLMQLLQNEQNTDSESEVAPALRIDASSPRPKNHFMRPVFDVLAAAAGIMLVAGILFPSLSKARLQAQQAACEYNLKQVGAGMVSLSKDNGDKLSQVRIKPGTQWMDIGYQGPENRSNTRYPWQLVKQGYVKPEAFICKGHTGAKPVCYDASAIQQLNDFPSRQNISYSFMLLCDKTSNSLEKKRRVIAGDMNPIFKQLAGSQPSSRQMTEVEKILLNETLRQILSENHRGKGQNLLYCDGSVEFMKVRIINGDDIYTLRGVDAYTGLEMPSDPEDIFLAP